eukprot:TRINITY_DN11224_c0_g1_i5.p1 TRINITY_DN11224_c0_g1~~TRINITY_DN11224_c0_g1_i5.p1  ORF type:complete len:753 (-),score=105.50 TRINITY_DN11224_c0_g1_i5:283-2541(-)
MFWGRSGGRLLAESVEDIDDFTVCKWNVTNAVCSADTEEILNSGNLTSIDTQLIRDVRRMLACSSHGQNSTDCAADEYCREDAHGTCRASSGPKILRFIFGAIVPSFQQCGWLSEFFNGVACPAHSLSECSKMVCKPTQALVQSRSGFCEEQTVCGDDFVSYMHRLCANAPGWDTVKMLHWLRLPDAGQLLNCSRALRPEFALRLEYELLDPCPALKSRVDCLSNDKCMLDVNTGCKKDPFKVFQRLVPPSCPLTEGLAWSFRCSEARSPDQCALLGRKCTWEVSEQCNSSGQAVEVAVCRGAPETLGMYIRPLSKRKNKFSNQSIDPTIDLLSRTIASAHVCPSLAKQHCQHSDSSSSKYGGASSEYDRSSRSDIDEMPMEVIIPTAAGTVTLILVCAMIWLCCRKNKRQAQCKQQAAAAAQVEQPQEGTCSSSSDSKGYLRSSSSDFSATAVDDMLSRGASEHWFIVPSSLDLLPSVIGKGSYGEVRRGTLFGNTEVAVKLPYKQKKPVLANKALVNEIRLQRRIRHPNIVLFHGVTFVDRGETVSLGIVLEWVSGGDLRRFVKDRHESGRFHEDCKVGALIKEVKIIMDVARGLGYLHSQSPPILHRDVKPENILVESHNPPLAKIADFGLSSLEDGRHKGQAGSIRYMAPEIEEGSDYGLPADVYSFGRVVFFINKGTSIETTEPQGQWYLPSKCQELAMHCTAVDSFSRPVIGDVYVRLCCTNNDNSNSNSTSSQHRSSTIPQLQSI